MLQLYATTIRELLQFLHDLLEAALTVLCGLALTEKIKVWTVENADIDQSCGFQEGDDKSEGKAARCLPFGTVLQELAATYILKTPQN